MSTTAAKTIDDLMTEVRATLNDVGINGAGFRFDNSLLLNYINTAFRELYRYRPDAWIGNFTSGILTAASIPTYTADDLGTGEAFPVDDRLFFNPVAFFVVGRAELADDEFTDQSRAQQLMQSFRAMLIGPGG